MIGALQDAIGWLFWPYSALVGLTLILFLAFAMGPEERLRKENRWLVFFGPLAPLFPEDPMRKTDEERRYHCRSLVALGCLLVLRRRAGIRAADPLPRAQFAGEEWIDMA